MLFTPESQSLKIMDAAGEQNHYRPPSSRKAKPMTMQGHSWGPKPGKKGGQNV